MIRPRSLFARFVFACAALGACGGKMEELAGQDAGEVPVVDASLADAQTDSAIEVARDAGSLCVNVDLSTYERSCNVSSDCVLVMGGEICSPACNCGGSTPINRDELSRYDNATRGVAFASCPCAPLAGSLVCGAGVCLICSTGSTAPGCADSGS